MVQLFSRECEDRYEFRQNSDEDLGHRRSGLIDLGVNHEPSNKALHTFKNFDEGLVACFYRLGRLVVPGYQNRRAGGASERGRIRTDRRMLMAEKIGDAGGNAYTTMVLKKTVRNFGVLTRLTPSLRVGLAERVYKPVTTG